MVLHRFARTPRGADLPSLRTEDSQYRASSPAHSFCPEPHLRVAERAEGVSRPWWPCYPDCPCTTLDPAVTSILSKIYPICNEKEPVGLLTASSARLRTAALNPRTPSLVRFPGSRPSAPVSTKRLSPCSEHRYTRANLFSLFAFRPGSQRGSHSRHEE